MRVRRRLIIWVCCSWSSMRVRSHRGPMRPGTIFSRCARGAGRPPCSIVAAPKVMRGPAARDTTSLPRYSTGGGPRQGGTGSSRGSTTGGGAAGRGPPGSSGWLGLIGMVLAAGVFIAAACIPAALIMFCLASSCCCCSCSWCCCWLNIA
ncbi:hypothetical protein V8C86DRAFT_2725348 [Haematococcus lacustris]